MTSHRNPFRRSPFVVPTPEKQLQAACEDWLEKLWDWRLVMDWYHRPDRKAGHNERSGLPDLIIAVRPGLVLGVELKRADTNPTPKQAVWLAAFGERGAVCRSLEEFQAFLATQGVG